MHDFTFSNQLVFSMTVCFMRRYFGRILACLCIYFLGAGSQSLERPGSCGGQDPRVGATSRGLLTVGGFRLAAVLQ
jgi:hypothetical protein